MVEQTSIVVQAEQERANYSLLLRVTEAADDAVRGSLLLHLDHRPLPRAIFKVAPLRDDPVERTSAAAQPAESCVAVAGHGRHMQSRCLVRRKEPLELIAAFG